MKKTYETKVITVIFKNGETATFENCLDIYTMDGVYNVIFAADDHRIMVSNYNLGEVALVAKGYVDAMEVE